MGANMVHSQLETLEEPTKEETDVISIDVSGSKLEVEAEALRRVREAVKSEFGWGLGL
jgi:gluconokinase